MSKNTPTLFSEFAAKEFPRGITCYHSIKNLNEPLLTSPDQVDQHVSESCIDNDQQYFRPPVWNETQNLHALFYVFQQLERHRLS
jgi:hypothetical protein